MMNDSSFTTISTGGDYARSLAQRNEMLEITCSRARKSVVASAPPPHGGGYKKFRF
jgi:hypothetical protein